MKKSGEKNTTSPCKKKFATLAQTKLPKMTTPLEAHMVRADLALGESSSHHVVGKPWRHPESNLTYYLLASNITNKLVPGADFSLSKKEAEEAKEFTVHSRDDALISAGVLKEKVVSEEYKQLMQLVPKGSLLQRKPFVLQRHSKVEYTLRFPLIHKREGYSFSVAGY